MRLPKSAERLHTPVRSAARARIRARYPMGKALARIEFFEQQRGLALTRTDGTRVLRQQPVPAKGKKAAKGARARTAAFAVPRNAYADAALRKRAKVPRFAATVNKAVWHEIGPTSIPKGQTYGEGGNNKPPVSGRTVGIVIDPTDPRRLVLCSAGGGLWGSTDTGRSWRPLTDHQPTLSMGAIAAAPSSPNIVYAATGEGDTRSPLGVGLLRSSDGGFTWEHVPNQALSGTGVYDLAVDPADPLHIWICAVNGLFETRDAGRTVTQVRTELAWDISINPDDPTEIFLASEGGLFRSTNGGRSWSRETLPGAAGALERLEVCHAPSNPAVVYAAGAIGSRALLWRRSSAAGRFAAESVPARMDVSQAWYDWCFAVSPDDPNVVYWGAIELYRGVRTRGRWRWVNISSRSSGDSIHPDQHHIAFDRHDAQVVYVCNDGGLFRSPDGGTRWQALNPGLGITEFEFLAQLEQHDTWIMGGTQDNGTLAHAVGGRWDQVALGDGGDCGAVDGAEPICFHSYYDMWMERAPASGPRAFRWTDVSPPTGDAYQALFYPPMDVSGSIVTKAGQSVFVSGDRGDTWSEVLLPDSNSPEPDLASAIVIVDSSTIIVGTVDGNLYRITRVGRRWGDDATVTPLASPRHGYISDIVVPGSPSKTIWVSVSALRGGHVFRSLNGGTSWTDRTGNLPDIAVNAIVVDPKDTARVFAATDNGVYCTTNAGTRWTDFSNGLPNAVVGDLILHARLRLLRAGTRNRGAWEVGI
jgi:photosystem II stability/assembly factor-like uncharacterized protein